MTAPTPEQQNLTDFLLARIAEDEKNARDAESYFPDDGPFVRWDSERVLAECEAKRRIVDLARGTDSAEIHADAWTVTKRALRLLALPYSDHPDYREEWRP